MPLSPETLKRIREEASTRKGFDSGIHGPNVPIVWIPDGTTFVRFQPDSEGEYRRTLWRHKRNDVSFRCSGPNVCEACRLLRHLDEGGRWDMAWQFKSRQVSLAYGVIVEYAGAAKSQYVKTGIPVLLMYTYKLAKRLDAMICDLGSTEEIQKFFDPDEPYRVVQIHSWDRGLKFSMDLMKRRSAKVSALPEHFPPLREMIFTDDETPPPWQVEKFNTAIEKAYMKWKEGNQNTR